MGINAIGVQLCDAVSSLRDTQQTVYQHFLKYEMHIRYKSVPDVHVIFRKLLAHLEPDFEAKMT